jgi:hypothetical protein
LIVRRFVRIYIMPAAIVLYSGYGWAASWQQTGSARMSTEYDTNPNMALMKPDGVWHATFMPSYSLTGSFGENELNTGVALQSERSSNKTLIQNRDDPSAFLEWKLHSEEGEFGVSSKFDQTATRISESAISGPGLADSTRTARTMSGSWSGELGERSTFLADGSYEDVSYSSGAYNDYVMQSGDMIFKYEWSEIFKPFINTSYSNYEPKNSISPSHSAVVALGFDWITSDYLEGTLQVGKSRDSSAGMGTTGAASLHYTGQRNEHFLNASRQVSASGLSGFVTVDQANWNWNFDFNELNTLGIDLAWQKNHYVDTAYNSSIGAWQQHEINPLWELRTYYLHRNSHQVGVGGATSDILGVTLAYTNANF